MRGGAFLHPQEGLAEVVAIAESAVDGNGFEGFLGFYDKPLGPLDPHACDLLGDAFFGEAREAPFEASAVEAYGKGHVLHGQGTVAVLGHEAQGGGDERILGGEGVGGLSRDEFFGVN